MNADTYIKARALGDAITLVPKTVYGLVVIGSSCPMSAFPGQRVDTVSVTPDKDEGGDVVAVVVPPHLHVPFARCFLLRVFVEEGRAHVELDELFVPKADRSCGAGGDSGISVVIGEEHFLVPMTWLLPAQLAKLRQQYRLLPSNKADLLCRYIVGKATKEEVIEVADKLTAETNAVNELLEKVSCLEAELVDAKAQVGKLEAHMGRVAADMMNYPVRWSKLEGELRGKMLDVLYDIRNVCSATNLPTEGLFTSRDTTRVGAIKEIVATTIHKMTTSQDAPPVVTEPFKPAEKE